jgi:sigma-B regulation protein RsbU (phosphoserine phosphatase)
LRKLNADLFPLLQDKGQFLTLVYALVSSATGEVKYANAGHSPIAAVRAGPRVEDFDSTGPPIGMVADLPVESRSFAMGLGDSIWLYTDGLFEPASLARSGSGRKWLLEAILEAQQESLHEWVQAVLAGSQSIADRSEIDDDMALLAAVRVPV